MLAHPRRPNTDAKTSVLLLLDDFQTPIVLVRLMSLLVFHQHQHDVHLMKTITMVELRNGASDVLSRLSKGERLVLSHRGKPVARLEPFHEPAAGAPETDPFLTVGSRATPSRKGPTPHQQIDSVLYGKR